MLEARLNGLRKEIQDLERVENVYHSKGEVIQVKIEKVPITLYSTKNIIDELRRNNGNNEGVVLNLILNVVYETQMNIFAILLSKFHQEKLARSFAKR